MSIESPKSIVEGSFIDNVIYFAELIAQQRLEEAGWSTKQAEKHYGFADLPKRGGSPAFISCGCTEPPEGADLAAMVWICCRTLRFRERELNKWQTFSAADFIGRYSKALEFPELKQKILSDKGRHAANERHNQDGGSRDKRRQVQNEWSTGKYKTRDECAEKVSESLNISFATARKALRNTPSP